MQCGKCCSLVFRCPFLNRENQCTIYHKGRPRHCKTFPLDNKDLQDIGGECGYYFE
jgi:Fe-S-cluster containining protein